LGCEAAKRGFAFSIAKVRDAPPQRIAEAQNPTPDSAKSPSFTKGVLTDALAGATLSLWEGNPRTNFLGALCHTSGALSAGMAVIHILPPNSAYRASLSLAA
jgi:hypothetical protein